RQVRVRDGAPLLQDRRSQDYGVSRSGVLLFSRVRGQGPQDGHGPSPGKALRAQDPAHLEQDDRLPPRLRAPCSTAVGVPAPHVRLPQAAGIVPTGVLHESR
ncbi:unnamed protein product, partial [Ectocarpus sp. 12 AP-2014]